MTTVTSDRLWAYIEISAGGVEGLVGFAVLDSGQTLPMVTTKPELIPAMDEIARRHARTTGLRVERRRFDGAELEEVFRP